MTNDFFWGFLPFWVVNYGLALVAWTCVGRYLLAMFVPPQTTNYIFRWFVLLTDWAVSAVSFVTPAFVQRRYLPLLTALWCFAIRFVSFPIFYSFGMLPSVTSGS
jgi:hypothetical protein